VHNLFSFLQKTAFGLFGHADETIEFISNVM